MEHGVQNQMLNILLADDDADERYFFEIALKELPVERNLITVSDGEQLMEYLSQKTNDLPDVLFLDILMPQKDGVECLKEIMSNERLKSLPIVMYSTSFQEDYVNICYKYGASYFMQKGMYSELKASIEKLLIILGRNSDRISKDKFKFNLKKAY